MYILYGGKFTRAVAPQMVLEEAELPYELREVDIVADEHRAPAFLSINPAGFVPALVIPEGQMLHEAAAIMLYLADRHHLSDLIPDADSPERGQFYAKFFFLSNDIQPAMKRYYYPHRYSSDPADTPRIKTRAFETAVERWGVVEQHLAGNGPYHLGDRVSLVDFYMAMWAAFGFEESYDLLDHHPAIANCYEMVRERPRIKPLLMGIEDAIDDYALAIGETVT